MKIVPYALATAVAYWLAHFKICRRNRRFVPTIVTQSRAKGNASKTFLRIESSLLQYEYAKQIHIIIPTYRVNATYGSSPFTLANLYELYEYCYKA